MMKKIFNNPELIKNIQLEINFMRMIFMPIILFLLFCIAYYMPIGSSKRAYSVQIAAFVLCGIVLFVWGTKMATESLIGEFNEKTWDNQRMTSISPWDMAVGKLFGSTLFAWYGGLICLVVFVLTSIFPTNSMSLMKPLFIMVFAGVAGQAIILSHVLMEFSKNRDSGKLNSSSYSIAGILSLMIAIPFAIGTIEKKKAVLWYTLKVLPIDMVLYSSIFFLIWGLISLYRRMRKELQFENSPWVWTIFIASLMIYCSGFIPNINGLSNQQKFATGLYLCFSIGLGSFYLMAFAEPKNIVDIRWLLDKARTGRWNRFFLKLPAWLISFILTVICAIPMIFTLNLSERPHWFGTHIQLSPVIYLIFCLRDLGIIFYANVSSIKKNKDIAAVFYLFICYFLIPYILNILGAKSLLPWFLPFVKSNLLNSLLPVFLQTLFIFYIIKVKWLNIE